MENKKLIKSFLNRTFLYDMKKKKHDGLFSNLELMLTSKCNLNCKYCYYNDKTAFGEKLNPSYISTPDNILSNTDALLNWLEYNEAVPSKIELFGGEVLIQNTSFEIIEKCINFYDKFNKKGTITIPTNMSFLKSDKKTNKIIELKKKTKSKNIGFGLSASVDGKYMDYINRPFGFSDKQHLLYSDEYYNKIFQFAKDYGCGFHPMIYHNNIDQWKKNFDWFQEKFEEFGLPWNNIYLLEVRNQGWTKKTVKSYMDFYKYVLDFALNKLDGNKDKFIKAFILNGCKKYKSINKMNMFNNTGKIGRGIGCSMQTTLPVRMGDLTVSSCHRQSYDMFNGFKFLKNENNEIDDIEPLNLEYYMATISTDRINWPYCESCMINNICMSGCLGAQYEAMGDPFTPIPSVCLLEHGKVKAQIEWFVENNMFVDFLHHIDQEQAKAFENFYKKGEV